MASLIQGKRSNSSLTNLHRVTFRRVSSAVVQRYLNPILDAALSQNPQIQAAAIDVLSFTIKQGLAHPLQVGFFHLPRL